MKQISPKQRGKMKTWAKVSKIRDDLLTARYGFLLDEWTGKRLKGTVEHHHKDRDRSNNTLENCRTVSSKSHRYITDENVTDVPDRLGLQTEKRKLPDRPQGMSGYHGTGIPWTKEQQAGRKKG